MKKLALLVVAVLSLVMVASFSIAIATPTRNSPPEIIEAKESNIPVRVDCPRGEWNNMFAEYRSGHIPKDEMKEYIKSCGYVNVKE